MAEERLEGGYVDGAVRRGETVRRLAGPWTSAVHALLAYLADQGFAGAPRPLGFDEQGREVLTFLGGETIGHRKLRPAWVYAEDTLVQVAGWMRDYHQIVADFVPAAWRRLARGRHLVTRPDHRPQRRDHPQCRLAPGQAHRVLRLGLRRACYAGVGPGPGRLQLGAAARPVCCRRRGVHRLHGQAQPAGRFLGTYGWSGTTGEFLDVVEARMRAHAAGIRGKAAAGDEPSGRLRWARSGWRATPYSDPEPDCGAQWSPPGCLALNGRTGR